MRPGQQKNRMRGRGRKGPNPLSRSYESNGPDVKIRGNAQHIAEKYSTLARDSAASGDRVIAENYLQHAEHYYRIVASAQPQGQQRDSYDDNQDDDGDDDQDSGNSYQDDRNDNSERQNFDRQSSDRHSSDRQPQARNDRNERNDRGDRNDRGSRDGNRERDGNRDRDTSRDRDGNRSNSNNNGNRPDRDRNDRSDRDRPDRDRTDRDRNERTDNDRGDRNDRGRNDRNERDRDGRREPVAADGTGPQPAIENGFVGADRESERKPHDKPQVNGNGNGAAPRADDAEGTGRNGEESDRPRRRGRTRRKRPDDGFGSAGGSDETSPQGEAPAQVADVLTERAVESRVESSGSVTAGEEAPVKRKPGRPRKKKDDAAEKDGGENDLPDFLLASNG